MSIWSKIRGGAAAGRGDMPHIEPANIQRPMDPASMSFEQQLDLRSKGEWITDGTSSRSNENEGGSGKEY